MNFVLASRSPARKKILEDFGYNFEIYPSNFEEILDKNISVEENAKLLAEGKARDVFEILKSQLVNSDKFIVACDTIMVDPYNNYIGKPKNRENAKKMMQIRSGKMEKLITGICILSKDFCKTATEEARIYWPKLSDTDIEKILETGEWEGKCGGIAIEGFSGMYIKRIEGSMQNIMGFPLGTFREMI